MRRLALLFSVVVLLGVTPNASATYIGVHWRRTVNPATVTVVTSLQSRFLDPTTRAAGLWSVSDVIDMVLEPGGTGRRSRQNCAYIRGKVHICSGSYGNTGWVGLTQFKAQGHHIIAVRVRLNTHLIPRNFDTTVTCHELGHSIGLGHRSQSTSCMKQGRTSSRPDSNDYSSLDKIYAHLDGMTPESATVSSFSTQ